jgi:4-hydroxybenzoate polyprenyltransferase
MLAERMLFVFAITIPFDIRDMESDKQAHLKTIPNLMGEKKAIQSAVFALLLFAVIGLLHYLKTPLAYILPALLISAGTTYVFITHEKIKKQMYYYYGILDGTIFFQGLMVITSYYIFTD